MSEDSKQYKKREEILKLIEKNIKKVPILEVPYDPNIGLPYDMQLMLFESRGLIEFYIRYFEKKKIEGKN